MISETITIPKTVSDQEDRFVLKLKENLLRMIKEINKNSKKISEITTEEHEDPDYTDEFNKKADVKATNIGYGDLFLEIKDDEGEVIYSAEDNREDWGLALTNSKNTIASDNVTLVSSQNVYNETHPYMEKDASDHWINPYHYINYKNLSRHEGAEDINKQDRWSEQEFYEPNEPNDNTVKENLVALDTAIWEVAKQLDDKANISLDNLNQNGLLLINAIGMGSTYVRDWRELGVQDPLVKVDMERVQDPETGLYTNVYTVYSDYDPSGGGDQDDALYAQIIGKNVGWNMDVYDIYGIPTGIHSIGNTNPYAWEVVRDKYYSSGTTFRAIVNDSLEYWGNALGSPHNDAQLNPSAIHGIRNGYYDQSSPYTRVDDVYLANLYGIRKEVELQYNGDAYFTVSTLSNYGWTQDDFEDQADFNLNNILDYAATTGYRLGYLQEAIFQLSATIVQLQEQTGISLPGNGLPIGSGSVYGQTLCQTHRGVGSSVYRNSYLNQYVSKNYIGVSSSDYQNMFPMVENFTNGTNGVIDSDTGEINTLSYRDFDRTRLGSFGTSNEPSSPTTSTLSFSSLPLSEQIKAMAQTVDELVSAVNSIETSITNMQTSISNLGSSITGITQRIDGYHGSGSGSGGSGSSS